jgi:hypothetical protein
MLQEIRARERDMRRIQAELDALRSGGAGASRAVKRKRTPLAPLFVLEQTTDQTSAGEPSRSREAAKTAEETLDACLGLCATVLGVSFSHVSSSLVPSRDGRMRATLLTSSSSSPSVIECAELTRPSRSPSRAVIIKRYDIRGKAASSLSFMLLLQVQVPRVRVRVRVRDRVRVTESWCRKRLGERESWPRTRESREHRSRSRRHTKTSSDHSPACTLHVVRVRVRVSVRPLLLTTSPSGRRLEETNDAQLFLSRLAEFAELAEAREALWRNLKRKYAAQVALPHGLSSTLLWFTPLRSPSSHLRTHRPHHRLAHTHARTRTQGCSWSPVCVRLGDQLHRYQRVALSLSLSLSSADQLAGACVRCAAIR